MPAVDQQSSTSEESDEEPPDTSGIHPSDCSCVHCIIAREGYEDEVAIYEQYGSVFDANIPGEIAQDSPPLMIDYFPSIYDENKWAVRPAGARPDGVP